MATEVMPIAGLQRVARAVERQHKERRLRAAMSGIAAATLILAVVLLVLAHAVGQERAERSQALRPVAAGEDAPRLHVGSAVFPSVAQEQVTVQVVVPTSDDVPPPPGVQRWPAPGNVVASPRLLELMDADGGRRQFGDVDGVISDDGLIEPSELRLYVRPSAETADVSVLDPASGWSGDAGRERLYYPSLALADAFPTVDAAILVAATLGFGALASLFLARRVGARQQLESESNLRLAGASAVQLAMFRVMSAARYVLGGAVAAACVVAVLCTVQFSLPFVSFVSDPAAYRAWPAGVALSFVAGLALCLAVVAAPVFRGRPGSGVSAREERPAWWVWVFVAGAGLAMFGPIVAKTGMSRSVSYLLGVGLVMVGLPAVIALVTAIAGRSIAGRSVRVGSAGGIVAGRYLQRRPRTVARVAAPACIGLLFVGQAQLWTGQLSDQYLNGVQVQARVGGSALTASRSASPDELTAFVRALPDDVGHVYVWVAPPRPGEPPGSPGQTRVGGTCADLQTLGLPCPSSGPVPLGEVPLPRTSDVIEQTVGLDNIVIERVVIERLDAASERVSGPGGQLVIFSVDGENLARGELQRLGFATVQGGIGLEPLAQSWVGGGHRVYIAARWVSLYGAAAVALLLLVSAGLLAAEARSRAERLAGVAATFGSTRWRVVYVAVDVALPTVLSATLGSVCYLVLPFGFQSDGLLNPSTSFAVSAAAASVVVAASLAGVTAHYIRTAARDWRPGAAT
ncbi:MAG: hypothetical protein ACRCXL_09570 [Dermatophilaceae bacterium]